MFTLAKFAEKTALKCRITVAVAVLSTLVLANLGYLHNLGNASNHINHTSIASPKVAKANTGIVTVITKITVSIWAKCAEKNLPQMCT